MPEESGQLSRRSRIVAELLIARLLNGMAKATGLLVPDALPSEDLDV
jgi:hypothetical protein